MATVRCCGSWNMLRIRDSVDGASVAPATPSRARAAISISALVEKRGEHRGEAERGGADQQQPAATDPVAQRAHGDQRAGDQEAVDVDDPEQLGAARLEVRAQCGHREVQHGQVHRVDAHGRAITASPIHSRRPALAGAVIPVLLMWRSESFASEDSGARRN